MEFRKNQMKENKKIVDTRAYVGLLKELVEQGKEVRMVITGSSMAPFLIHARDSIFFRTPEEPLRKGDMVFYERSDGQFVMHRICRVTQTGKDRRYDLIGDAQTEIEHGIAREQIFARVVKVERKGKMIKPGDFWWEFFEKIWIRMIPARTFWIREYGRYKKKDGKSQRER